MNKLRVSIVLALSAGLICSMGCSLQPPESDSSERVEAITEETQARNRNTSEPSSRYGLQIDVAESSLGLQVTDITPLGPGHRLRAPNASGVRGLLDIGDYIVKVDGVAVTNRTQYDTLLNETRGGEVTLEVLDIRSGQTNTFIAQPELLDDGNDIRRFARRRERGRLYAVLAGRTDDPSIGDEITLDLHHVQKMLARIPGVGPDDLRLFTGSEASSQNILQAIKSAPVASNDTLVVYVGSHGAYDASQSNTYAGGHFLHLYGKSLRRSKLFNVAQATAPRLLVLVTDSCNSPIYPGTGESSQYAELSRDELLLQRLFLEHEGVIDINGAARGDFAWFQSQQGGNFSTAFTSQIDPQYYPHPDEVSWDLVLGRVRNETNRIYQEQRRNHANWMVLKIFNADARQMWAQRSQYPQVFTNTLRPI